MSDPQPSDAQPLPTPATPLNYSHAASYHGRPGIITAVGVMSIIVACLSGLTSLWGAFRSGMYYYVSTQSAAAFTTTVTPPPGTQPTLAPPPRTASPALTATPATTAPTTAPAAAGGTIVYSHSVSYSGVGGLGGGFVAATTAPTTTPTSASAGAPATAAAPPAMANPFGRINPLAAILAIVTELLSLGLAVLLLVAAIQILRDAPSGPRLHRWYALAKIPLVILGTAVSLWLTLGMMRSIMASMGPAGGGAAAGQQSAFMWSFMAVQTIVPALLALAYPVALLIILRSRTVREYYNAVRDDGAALPDSFDSRAG